MTKNQAIAAKQKMTLLNSMLKGAVRRLPILGTSNLLPYTCARNAKQYYTWSVGKRKALEVSWKTRPNFLVTYIEVSGTELI